MKLQTGPLVVLVAGIVAACDGETRWAGTITDSAGVTIASNTDVGIWAPGEEWTLEEELRIGALEGPAEYQIGQVGSIALDSKGRILVLDGQAQHIQAYSPDGIYERTIGARGGGPGELGNALALLMGTGDTLLVPDGQNLRFTRYAPDGSSVGSIRLDPEGAYPMAFKAAASGAIVEQIRLYALPGQPAIEEPIDVLVRLAIDGSVTDTLMAFPSGKKWVFDGPYREFAAEPLWDLTKSSQVVLAVSDEYRIGVYADGHLKRIITKPFDPERIGEADERAIREEMERRMIAAGYPAETRQLARDNTDFAEYLPTISTLAAGPAGTIWVQRMRRPSELSDVELASIRESHLNEDLGAPGWDVFDREGRYLGVVKMPDQFTPSVFRDDKIYGVWRDELNVEYVLRLRIIGDLDVGAT
jgi:hypothetical protein